MMKYNFFRQNVSKSDLGEEFRRIWWFFEKAPFLFGNDSSSRWLLCNISVKLENRDFDLIDVGGDYSLFASLCLYKNTLFYEIGFFLSKIILIGCHFNKWKFLLRYRTFRKNAPLGKTKTYFMLRRYFRHLQVPTTSMLSRSLFFVVCAIVRK